MLARLKAIANGDNAATDAVAGVDDGRAQPSIFELSGCRKAGKTCAGDEHVDAHIFSARESLPTLEPVLPQLCRVLPCPGFNPVSSSGTNPANAEPQE